MNKNKNKNKNKEKKRGEKENTNFSSFTFPKLYSKVKKRRPGKGIVDWVKHKTHSQIDDERECGCH